MDLHHRGHRPDGQHGHDRVGPASRSATFVGCIEIGWADGPGPSPRAADLHQDAVSLGLSNDPGAYPTGCGEDMNEPARGHPRAVRSSGQPDRRERLLMGLWREHGLKIVAGFAALLAIAAGGQRARRCRRQLPTARGHAPRGRRGRRRPDGIAAGLAFVRGCGRERAGGQARQTDERAAPGGEAAARAFLAWYLPFSYGQQRRRLRS